jgi:hypothetical protein
MIKGFVWLMSVSCVNGVVVGGFSPDEEIRAWHFVGCVIPASFSVIPALSRDPLRTAVLCKRLWCKLDPGSSPGMTKVLWLFELHRAGSIKPPTYRSSD